ncbi:uncharacterized protein LOC110861340 [Folsomia candida]|uniref:uncharacterized protein LOC110861340 n=1 Tax=Folsomia candida TaxID=158441 RepID=UPI001604FEA7|nr:uncharacterized protein LOC110861340 [Folsomia candida]
MAAFAIIGAISAGTQLVATLCDLQVKKKQLQKDILEADYARLHESTLQRCLHHHEERMLQMTLRHLERKHEREIQLERLILEIDYLIESASLGGNENKKNNHIDKTDKSKGENWLNIDNDLGVDQDLMISLIEEAQIQELDTKDDGEIAYQLQLMELEDGMKNRAQGQMFGALAGAAASVYGTSRTMGLEEKKLKSQIDSAAADRAHQQRMMDEDHHHQEKMQEGRLAYLRRVHADQTELQAYKMELEYDLSIKEMKLANRPSSVTYNLNVGFPEGQGLQGQTRWRTLDHRPLRGNRNRLQLGPCHYLGNEEDDEEEGAPSRAVLPSRRQY